MRLSKMSKRGRLAFLLIVVPPVLLLFIALGGEIVRQLWNWLLPGIFGWPRISFWQALGLLALCRILFGGFGRHGGGSRIRRRIAERCEEMTPEERERFRQAVRGRWGFDSPGAESESPGAVKG